METFQPLIMAFPVVYSAVGVLVFLFSKEMASAMNRFSVRIYEIFPRLKVLPGSQHAGTQLNYRSSLYFFRIMGGLISLTGVIMFGMMLLHH